MEADEQENPRRQGLSDRVLTGANRGRDRRDCREFDDANRQPDESMVARPATAADVLSTESTQEKKKKKSTSGGSAKAARRRSALLAIHRHAGSSVVHLEIVDTDGEYWMHISECSAFFSPSPSLQVVATSCTPYLRSWRTRGTLLQRIIRRPHATSCSGVSHPTCLSSLSYIWLCFCSKSH